MKVGAVIRMVRGGLDMSAAELAQRVGLSRSYMSNLELGNREMTFTILTNLCNALNVSLPLVVMLAHDEDEAIKPFVHSAYAMLWGQIRKAKNE